MISKIRAPATAAAFALLAAALPAGAWAAESHSAGGPATFTIGVDHSTPPNHNFEYVDYFPRSGLKLHTGDIVDFAWALTPDGLHTATLLASGETPAQALDKYRLAVEDKSTGDPSGALQINPAIIFPSNPTCGGSASNPCAFDGGSDLNSGATPTDGASHFFARIDAAAGTQINFICLIHPGMGGTARVVSAGQEASEPGAIRRLAFVQGVKDTIGAFGAEERAERTAVQENPDGTHTITMTAGTATPFVEVAEMLPRRLHIQPGDTVKFVTKSIKDPHTVTFPAGNGPGEPLPMLCETPSGDVPFQPSTGPPCGNPALFEIGFEPAPGGSTVISTPTTFGTSGVIAPFPPFPNNYSFTFPNAGTFAYQCRIHDHMVGTIVSQAEDGD